MASALEEPQLCSLVDAAREQERRRWARELHDETLQSLAALRVQLSGARRTDDVAALRSVLDSAVEELGREIANVRALITELRPASLDELGLEPALEALFERLRTVHGMHLRTRLALETGGRLEPETETAVYRIVQEALTNVRRHAGAERVDVTLRESEGEIAVTVADDGCGFDPGAGGAGFGLTGMRERVDLAGGRIDIATSRAGSTIVAVLPAWRRHA